MSLRVNCFCVHLCWTANKKKYKKRYRFSILTPGINNQVKECTTIAHKDVRSDHICILLEQNVCKTQTRTKKKAGMADEQGRLEQLESAVRIKTCLNGSNPNSNDVDEVFSLLKETIDRIMLEVIKWREVKRPGGT